MDLKISNLNYGELAIENNDLSIVNYSNEIIQQIAIMLKIRAGELEYDTNYGLNWFYWETGNKSLVEEDIKNKITTYFKEVEKINSIDTEFLENDRRRLKVDISLNILGDESLISLEV